MAGGEPRFGMAWMYMHTQVGTGLATKQARSEALHAHILGSRKPEFVQSQRLTSAESKKLGLAEATRRLHVQGALSPMDPGRLGASRVLPRQSAATRTRSRMWYPPARDAPEARGCSARRYRPCEARSRRQP